MRQNKAHHHTMKITFHQKALLVTLMFCFANCVTAFATAMGQTDRRSKFGTRITKCKGTDKGSGLFEYSPIIILLGSYRIAPV